MVPAFQSSPGCAMYRLKVLSDRSFLFRSDRPTRVDSDSLRLFPAHHQILKKSPNKKEPKSSATENRNRETKENKKSKEKRIASGPTSLTKGNLSQPRNMLIVFPPLSAWYCRLLFYAGPDPAFYARCSGRERMVLKTRRTFLAKLLAIQILCCSRLRSQVHGNAQRHWNRAIEAFVYGRARSVGRWRGR